MSDHITGRLIRAGTFPTGADHEEITGVVVDCSVEALRSVSMLPMYQQVTVLPSDELAALRAERDEMAGTIKRVWDALGLHGYEQCKPFTISEHLERLRADKARLTKGIKAVAALISESYGVTGLHLNGDVAPWSELRTGGRFESWLADFDAAMQLKEDAK